MKNILDLLRRPQLPESAEIRQALAGLKPDHHAEGEIAKLEQDRRTALLNGIVGADMEAIEAAKANAVRERDRTAIFREELTARLAKAEEVEKVDALMARKTAAEVEGRAIAKLFTRFEPLLEELGDMLRRSSDHYNQVQSVNQALAAIGSTDRVEQTPRPNYGVTEGLLQKLVHGVKPITT